MGPFHNRPEARHRAQEVQGLLGQLQELEDRRLRRAGAGLGVWIARVPDVPNCLLAHPLVPLDLPVWRPVAAEGDAAAPQLLRAAAAAGAGAAALNTPGGGR